MGKPRDSRNHGVLKKWRETYVTGMSGTRKKEWVIVIREECQILYNLADHGEGF